MDISEGKIKYLSAVHDTDRSEAERIVTELEKSGNSPESIVFKVIVPSIENMMDDFMKDEIVLSQHFISVRISEELIDSLIPRFIQREISPLKVIIGTAKGDFHGLGKKIVNGSLKANMMQVTDLGLNVSAETFVDTAVAEGASIIGISSMMVHSAIGDDGPKLVRKLLDDRGLSDSIKLVVGGAPYLFDENMYLDVGADGWAANGVEAAKMIIKLTEGGYDDQS